MGLDFAGAGFAAGDVEPESQAVRRDAVAMAARMGFSFMGRFTGWFLLVLGNSA